MASHRYNKSYIERNDIIRGPAVCCSQRVHLKIILEGIIENLP